MHSLSQLRHGELLGAKHLKLTEQLSCFPEEIYSLSDTLEVLDLSGTGLSELPDDMGRFQKLRVFFASNNRFTAVPDSLGDCLSLQMMGFKHNRIVSVSERCLPPNLRWLILTDNCIEKLPDNLGDLVQMEKLALAGNQLKSLPCSMRQMTKLGLLRISANRLTEFPNLLLTLPKLAWLAFSGNPFCAKREQHQDFPLVALNQLNIQESLGRGASGVISRAEWVARTELPAEMSVNASEPVAIKVFHGDVTSDGYPEDELDACLSVSPHPNLVSAIARIEEADCNALVMRLIPQSYFNLGQPPSLESCTRDVFTKGQAFTQQQINLFVSQMTSLLEHLEAAEVCHGDLYAHNTLVAPDGHLLFGDFGAASRYQNLTDDQKTGIRRIERRALKHFEEDLQSVVSDQTIR